MRLSLRDGQRPSIRAGAGAHATPERQQKMDSDTQVIWSEFGHRLRAFIRQRVRNEEDAEDILQEVFLRIHRYAGGVNQSDRLTSWLFQVTRNAIADYYRAPARREHPESFLGTAEFDRPEPAAPELESDLDSVQARTELASCLRPMVERLPPHYRQAVALVDLSGLPQTEAAAHLGLSVSGMKSRVQRGRRSLKEILVACCPVETDGGGRVVDFDRPDSGCAGCGGADETVTLAANRGHGGPCCAPASARTIELQAPARQA
jgi:RNA polymerase sigma-70 factor (ECF subfamily)